MELTTEDGTVINNPSKRVLQDALDRVGLSEDGFAILSDDSGHYIQVAGNKKEGYIAEYREGDESTHHSSTAADLSHQQVVDLLTAYLSGSSWKPLISWQAGFNNKSDVSKNVIIVFFVIGVLVFTAGVYWINATNQFLDRAVEVEGTIVKQIRDFDKYTPVFKYMDLQGDTHILRSRYTTSDSRFFVGEKVTVAYEPGDPQDAIIVGYGEAWMLKLIMLILGGASCIAPIAFWMKFVRHKQKRLT